MATPKTLTTEECEKLLFALRKPTLISRQERKPLRNYTICLLMLDAGLRVGEVVQLRLPDLVFNSLPVTSIIIRPEIAKNKTERIIPISQRLSDALKKMNESYWSAADKYIGHWAFGSLNSNTHVTTRQVERIIRQAAMKSLGRPVHPHVLRHTFASRLMRSTSMRTVQELLGHTSLSSTQIYTHPNHEDLKKAIDGIDNKHPPDAPGPSHPSLTSSVSNSLNTPGTNRDMG